MLVWHEPSLPRLLESGLRTQEYIIHRYEAKLCHQQGQANSLPAYQYEDSQG